MAFMLASLATLWGPITSPLVDPFHEGEYLSARMLLTPALAPPLLIHGAMDYVPSAAAEAIFGPARVVAGTRLLNLLAAQLAAFAFIAALLALARNRTQSLAVILIAAAVLFLIDARSQTIVMLQQGSPSVRDLPLMVMTWIMLTAARRNGAGANRLAAAAGLIAGLCWVWSYNRGILMLAAVPAYALGAKRDGKATSHLAWLLAGLGAGLALNAMLEVGMWAQHFRNALYWTRNQSVWSAPVPLSLTARNMPFYLMGAASLAFGAWAVLRSWLQPRGNASLAALLPLGVIAAGNYLAIFNRPDPPHLMFAVPSLTLFAVAAWNVAATTVGAAPAPDHEWREILRKHVAPLLIVASILIVDVSAQTGSGTTRPLLQGLGRNLLTLVRGLPPDIALLEPKELQVTTALRAAGGPCTYVFDNSAAYYHLSGLSPCSSIMLPVYATPANESSIIADLERRKPVMVVGRSGYWTDHIDGRGLADRSPKLSAWLEKNYVVQCVIDGVELRISR